MDEQIVLDNIKFEDEESEDSAENLTDNLTDNNKNSDFFGCCGLYRECSDAGHCVHPDAERAKMCRYRSNLDMGNIFYGKNAQSFKDHKDDYDYLVAYNNSLAPEERRALSEIIFYICVENRGIFTHLCFYNELVYKVLSNCKLFVILTPPQLIFCLYEKDILNLESAKLMHGYRLYNLVHIESK